MAHFIHTSDWHLGNSFAGFDWDTARKLNSARLDAVKALFVYAQKKKIPFILCAGDVIDNGQLAAESILLDLFAVVKQFPRTRLILIAGNHDPLMANTIYRRVSEESYPENFQLARQRETIHIDDLGVKIFAASNLEKRGNANPLNWIQPEDIEDNVIHVGLAHGSLSNEKFKDNPFPIEPGFAREKKLDYLALGDWHSYNKINGRAYYCGTPEPLQFGDEGYALHVVIEKQGAVPKVEPIKVSQYEWRREEFELSDREFADFKAKFGPERPGEKVIRQLSAAGFLSAKNYKIYKEIIEMERERFYKIDDRVSITPTDADFLGMGDGCMNALLRRLIDMKTQDTPLPDEILDHVVPADLLNLEQEFSPGKQAVIDKALLTLHDYFRASGGEK